MSTPTPIDPTSAQARAQRRSATRAAAASGTNAADSGNGEVDAREAEAAIAGMSEAKILNLAEEKTFGKLGLVFKGLPIRRIASFQQELYERWPDVLLFAALSNLQGRGFNPSEIARSWTLSRRAQQPEAKEITISEVAGEIASLAMSLSSYDFTDPLANGKHHPLDIIAGHVWELCKETPDLTRETLPLLIADNLRPEELADLLRCLLCVLGGFPGDIASRLFGL